MAGQERRSLPRYQAPASLVAVVSFPTKADESVLVKNISLDGLCFVTETDISGESLFDLTLSCADGSAPLRSISVSARIAWHIHDEAASLHTTGVSFVEITEADKRSLRDFIGSLKAREAREGPPHVDDRDGGG